MRAQHGGAVRRERRAAVGDQIDSRQHGSRVCRLALPEHFDKALDDPRDGVQDGRPQLVARGEHERRRELVIGAAEQRDAAADVQVEGEVRDEAHHVEEWREAYGAGGRLFVRRRPRGACALGKPQQPGVRVRYRLGCARRPSREEDGRGGRR